MTLEQAQAWAATEMHKQWWVGEDAAWRHSYMDRLAWKLYNDVEDFAYCYARFSLLLKKRGIPLYAHPQEITQYYMARAQVRFAREQKRRDE